MGGNDDYLYVLKALQEIPFGVGKKLLTEFLQGEEKHKTIRKHQMHKYSNFGSLAYTNEEILQLINRLMHKDFIGVSSIPGNSFWKVLGLTAKGRAELSCPTLNQKISITQKSVKETIITDEDRKIFSAIPFLEPFNDAQKKAIICQNSRILCIAGAGSGKTTVLTKRIEFLTTYLSVDPRKILAITFTKKARQEMISRITVPGVSVETFNSFCEKMLQRHNHLLYDKEFRIINYREKILLFRKALSILGMPLNRAINTYFSIAQRRGKTPEKLMNIFMNDMYLLRDFFRARNLNMDSDSFDIDIEHQKSFKMVSAISRLIDSQMIEQGFRDFSDQLLETLSLFSKHPELIQKYDHILIDEFQDVNASQIQLIDLLNPTNLFAVGDPRQSIYGWRGSDIKYILNFEEKYSDCEIISLTINYRSTKGIVDLCNSCCKELGFADLKAHLGDDTIDSHLIKQSNKQQEFAFVIDKIISSDIAREEIFVLARTNRVLKDFSEILKKRKIKHVSRNDDSPQEKIASGKIMLSTVHAIKGMEAEMVFVIGCTSANFPCKGSDHPIMEIVNDKDYDKEEEEKRVLYVALSRAKKELYVTYVKSPSYFFSTEMMKLMGTKTKSSQFNTGADIIKKSKNRLRKNNSVKSNSSELEFSKSNLVSGTSGTWIKSRSIESNVVSGKNSSLSNEEIFAKLRNWRFEESKISKLPVYRVMHNKTLEELAQKKPKTVGELRSIYGLGPSKIDSYGFEILKVLHG
ncbi:UvrD-helicase domain-containing protein [archaeon]|jgi:superfamily I DNA/RNA helicase|nr:UvrD-helicase domain-containing protein [archaeon]MBT6761763.1 UvrD-helicase domain-containing protein [archaeon]